MFLEENELYNKKFKLPVAISFSAKLENGDDEVIPWFSANKMGWGPKCDALTWYLGNGDYTFRFKGYELMNNPELLGDNYIKPVPEKEYQMSCIITETSAKYSINGIMYAKVGYPAGTLASSGYFGFHTPRNKSNIDISKLSVRPLPSA